MTGMLKPPITFIKGVIKRPCRDSALVYDCTDGIFDAKLSKSPKGLREFAHACMLVKARKKDFESFSFN